MRGTYHLAHDEGYGTKRISLRREPPPTAFRGQRRELHAQRLSNQHVRADHRPQSRHRKKPGLNPLKHDVNPLKHDVNTL